MYLDWWRIAESVPAISKLYTTVFYEKSDF